MIAQADPVALFFSVVLAYSSGSFPTAVWVTNRIIGQDIRQMGDGNSGARNVTHVLGWKAGIMVGLVDFTKGALAVFLVKGFGLSLCWQLIAGAAAVIGHDFPVFAGFRGGQGMATSLGTMVVLFTNETLFGLVILALLYVFTKHFDLSAAGGLGMLVFLLWRTGRPSAFLLYSIFLFLTIPLKKYLDYRHLYQKYIHTS